MLVHPSLGPHASRASTLGGGSPALHLAELAAGPQFVICDNGVVIDGHDGDTLVHGSMHEFEGGVYAHDQPEPLQRWA